jgi:murein DD-endopeptidase MepM/ murein hydrolase activator NlpD
MLRPGVFLLLFIISGLHLQAIDGTRAARVADGFDFPVGKPDGVGYYKARGFRTNGHLGEDWNGARGGDTDLDDVVSAIGHGVVVLARDMRLGWGNVVIVRHAFYENGQLQYVDSLYGHLNRLLVAEGQAVVRGQNLGTIGSNHGMYDAHLHFEIRKNLSIGMNRASFARDFSNYYDPTAFIQAHRTLRPGSHRTIVAMNTFTPPYQRGRVAAPPADEHVRIEMSAPRVDANPVGPDTPSVTTNTSGKARGVFTIDRFSDLR